MKNSVKIKCSKKHDGETGYFDLTPDMIIASGNMVRTKCSECGASVILSWKTVADLLETTVEEAKAQLSNGEVPKIAIIQKSIIPDISSNGYNTAQNEPRRDEEEETTPTTRTTPVNEYTNMLVQNTPSAEPQKLAMRVEETPREDAPSTIGDTMGGFNVSEMDKTTNEVLIDVIRSQPGLNKTVVDEIIEYIGLKPEGWPPNMVKMILEAYKVTPSVSDVVVARYGMKLNMLENKRKGVDQLRGMLGNPGSTLPGMGGNAGGGFMPGMPGFGAQTPQNMGSQMLGMGPMGNQINPQQMWVAYQQDPNAFFSWLSSNPQYIQSWQNVFQQMQAMGMGMQRPMMQGMPGMPIMGMAPSGSGTSREEVRRMISGEMEQLKSAVQQIIAQNAPKPQGDETMKSLVIPMMLKMMDDKKPDSGNDFTQQLLGKLLDKSLEDKGGEMQFLLQKMEEMEKRREEIARATEDARKNSNPFSNVNSVDSLDTALKLHEVLGNFDIKREELKDKAKQRDMWQNVIGGGLDTLGKALSTVMMVKQSSGGSPPSAPIAVTAESTENVSSAKCDNCGGVITYAVGATRVVCPKCNTLYDIVPSGSNANIPTQNQQQYSQEEPKQQYQTPPAYESENVYPSNPGVENINGGVQNQSQDLNATTNISSGVTYVNLADTTPNKISTYPIVDKKKGRGKSKRDGV
jgi:ribosomal protein S27AE